MPLTRLRNFYFKISLASTVEANYLKDYCGLFPSIQHNSFIFTLVGNAIVSSISLRVPSVLSIDEPVNRDLTDAVRAKGLRRE